MNAFKARWQQLAGAVFSRVAGDAAAGATKGITKSITKDTTKGKGDAAEDRALAFLQANGLTLETRNARFKAGEIDLVMRDAAALVFVEVRARSSASHGGAVASIGAAKQRRIIAAAHLYLQARQGPLPACRFDVLILQGSSAPLWLKAAFTA